MTLDTCNSDFDTELEVYTGSLLSNLGIINNDSDGCPDASPNTLGSRVTFDAKSGITYRIRVDNEFCCVDPGGAFDLGLKLVDNVGPTVKSTTPVNQATGVSPSTNVTATFSEDMRASTVNGTTFKLFRHRSTATLAATVSYNGSTDKAILNPANSLQRGATYKAVVTTHARDLAGKRLDQNSSLSGLQQKVWSFKVQN